MGIGVLKDAEQARWLADRYDHDASAYAEMWAPVLLCVSRKLIRSLSLLQTRVVLDLGTGVGALLPDIAAAAPEALVFGVDRSRGMLSLARNRPYPIAQMDALRLAVRSSSVDAAVMAFVLFHLTEPVCALTEAARILRTGGFLIATVWGQAMPSVANDVWTEELDACGAPTDQGVPETRALMDSPEKLRHLLEQSGFAHLSTWSERIEERWDAVSFFKLRSSCGAEKRRLSILAPNVRAACLKRIRRRLNRLSADDLVRRPEVVYAIARK